MPSRDHGRASSRPDGTAAPDVSAGSLGRLVDRLGTDLDRPVVLYDPAMNVLAFSAHSSHDVDANRSAAILSRRTQPRALELVHEAGVHRAHVPVVVPSDAGLADRIGMPVRHGGALLGYLVCVAEPGDLPVTDRYRSIVVDAAADLGLLLHAGDLQRRTHRAATAATVRDLLGDDPAIRGDAAGRLLRQGMPASSAGHLVLTFSGLPPGADPGHSSLLELEVLLDRATGTVASSVIGAVIGGAAVLVLPVAPDHRRTVQRLADQLPDEVRLGIGAPRTDLVHVAGSAREAALALSGAWHDPARHGRIARWRDLGADQLLLRLPLDRMGPADLPEPVRLLLAARGGLELARTAESYLDHGGDAQATARAISIHRSTLYYRLDRIAALIGVDVRDGSVRHELHTGLRVATLCGLRPVAG
ncbi:PucR family transcriptional regulator [Aeromicrobium wangtongii]|uniref:Helix-turn-helix domain-containing protein n=1 Tax=Aeromicrobium wangtongii TaxID=2969247 RepID=A0ABY5MI31_9ACTN|nr:PucR family transcriptional regulator [Aeromicrobium wangtongii]MCD9199839.1 helix-turn-helix domain-containing protein [Aeromicrobium wangtongii]UUP15551.1 helix-turn-helix domain-containing protein [Aeromicrobium wangtongii]